MILHGQVDARPLVVLLMLEVRLPTGVGCLPSLGALSSDVVEGLCSLT